MKTNLSSTGRWLTVVTYAAAMAWVESAVVFYLRTLVDRIEPYQPNPLPFAAGFAKAELVREAATLIMLLTVGILAGRNWRSRLGYFAIAFGVWDIFYYVFLKFLCGWPHSLLDWDVIFLIPVPWWGPVAAPVSIALLLILWGTLASGWEPLTPALSPWDGEREASRRWVRRTWLLNAAGVLLALYVFTADCLPVAHRGTQALSKVLPTHFNWSLFSVALMLMGAAVLEDLFAICRTKLFPVKPLLLQAQNEKVARIL